MHTPGPREDQVTGPVAVEGTLEATESRASSPHFTEKNPGLRGSGTTPSFPMPWLSHTHSSEHVCQEDVPAQLPGIDFDQCLPCGKEALGVLVTEGSSGVQ